MPFDLPMSAVFVLAAVVTALALLGLLGWPRLRLRTHNQTYGRLRMIEIALILSRAAARPPGSLKGAGRYPGSGLQALRRFFEVHAVAPVTHREPGIMPAGAKAVLRRALGRAFLGAGSRDMPSAGGPSACGGAPETGAIMSARPGFVEFVMYITLRVGEP